MSLHHEHAFEEDICNHLAQHGWLYGAPGTAGDARSYDTPRALYPADVLVWLQATQPQAWASLQKNHGAALEATVLDRLRKALDTQGTLDVLRHGFDLIGLKAPLRMAQFRPALGMNAELQARYAANRLPASPISPSPPRPRPRRWSCLAAARSPTSPPARATCRRPSTSIPCARPSRRASSSMC